MALLYAVDGLFEREKREQNRASSVEPCERLWDTESGWERVERGGSGGGDGSGGGGTFEGSHRGGGGQDARLISAVPW